MLFAGVGAADESLEDVDVESVVEPDIESVIESEPEIIDEPDVEQTAEPASAPVVESEPETIDESDVDSTAEPTLAPAVGSEIIDESDINPPAKLFSFANSLEDPQDLPTNTTITLFNGPNADPTNQTVNITKGTNSFNQTIQIPTMSEGIFKGYFLGDSNTKLINETGVLIENIDGYTNNDGNWINESIELSLYAEYLFKPIVEKVTVTPDSVQADFGEQEITLSTNLTSGEDALPPEYVQLEYIQGDSFAYIDTGINATCGVDVEVMYTLTDLNNQAIFGARDNRESGETFRFWNIIYDSNFMTVGDIDNYVSYPVPIVGQTYVHKLITNSSGCWIYYDGIEASHINYVRDILDGKIWLFKIHTPHGGIQYKGNCKMYYAKLWENGNLVRNMLPAQRISDGFIGMYDTVNKKFYINNGTTGSFTCGPYVPKQIDASDDIKYNWFSRNETTGGEWVSIGTTSTNSTRATISKLRDTDFCVNVTNSAGFDNTSDVPMKFTAVYPSLKPNVSNVLVTPEDIQAEQQGVQTINLFPIFGSLPQGYRQLEYIQATGKAYIDTEIKAKSGVDVEVKYTLINLENQGIFGVRIAGTNDKFWNILYNGRPLVGIGGDNPARKVGTSVGQTYVHKLITNTSGWWAYYDEELVNSGNATSNVSDYNIWLFQVNYPEGGNSYLGSCKMHYAKLWENGVLVRNMLPAQRISDGFISMYDTVNKKFYINGDSTRGSFIPGRDGCFSDFYGILSYEWFSSNKTTNGEWVPISHEISPNVIVSTNETTYFYVNVSNILGFSNTSESPAQFLVYTTLTLDANGGSCSNTVVNATHDSSTLDKTDIVPKKDGYLFNGWDAIASPNNLTVINETGALNKGVAGYTDANGKWTNGTVGELTLYANWTPRNYTIQYYANNGTDINVSRDTYQWDKEVNLDSSDELGFIHPGYTFLNWTQYANGTGSTYAETQIVINLTLPDEPISFYAVWRVNETHALNTSENPQTIGRINYQKWSPAKESPYVVGYHKLNGTAEIGPFIIESPAAAQLNYTLTKENLTAAKNKGRLNVTKSDGTDLIHSTDYTIEDRDGKGYINLTESGRIKTGLSQVSVVVKEYPLGDANTNEAVDIVDSACIGIYILKAGGEDTDNDAAQIFLPKENQVHGDVNHDGKVDVADLLKLNQYIVGVGDLRTP